MPFTELAKPKPKPGAEKSAAYAAAWPAAAKILASQPTILRAFFGSVIRENEINTEEQTKTIIIMDEFADFARPIKPLLTGPAELQLFETISGPLKVLSAPLGEIIRFQLKNGAEPSPEAWNVLIEAVGTATPVTGGTSLNLSDPKFVGMIRWKSFEVRASILDDPSVEVAMA